MVRVPIASSILLLAVTLVEGSYSATTLRITPPGEGAADILAAGGSLTLTIDAQNQVTGTLIVPPSIGGGLNETMAGTAIVTGSNLRFDQTADTFVKDLTFAIATSHLRADQTLSSGARYEVVLSRQ